MPTVLPMELEPVIKSGRYRHMAKRDLPVWERFIDKHGGAFLGVVYDAALGGTPPPPDAASAADALGYQYATALKVDALLVSVDHVLVVEVRPWATVSALGAALCYTLVANREKISPLPLQPAIVCEGMQRDVEWACGQLGVLVYKV